MVKPIQPNSDLDQNSSQNSKKGFDESTQPNLPPEEETKPIKPTEEETEPVKPTQEETEPNLPPEEETEPVKPTQGETHEAQETNEECVTETSIEEEEFNFFNSIFNEDEESSLSIGFLLVLFIGFVAYKTYEHYLNKKNN